jgi:hypothetical protein
MASLRTKTTNSHYEGEGATRDAEQTPPISRSRPGCLP